MQLDIDRAVRAQVAAHRAAGRTPTRVLIGPTQARQLAGDFVMQTMEGNPDIEYTVEEFVESMADDGFLFTDLPDCDDLPVSVAPDVDGVEVLAE